jgi:RND family efflux transporter MFP subunit
MVTIKRHKYLVAVMALTFIASGLVLLGASKAEGPKGAPPPLEVAVAAVEQRDVPITSEWVATLDGMVNADIKAQVSGYLLSQNYQEGSIVTKGQVLFQIDPRPFEAARDQANGQVAQFEGQLQQALSQVMQAEAQVGQAHSQILEAQAQLARAQAKQTNAQLDADRYVPLAAEGVIAQQVADTATQANVAAKAEVAASTAGIVSARARLRALEAQVGTARAAVTTAQGQVENARAAVRTAELNLGFTRIVSPIDGVAGIAKAQVGDLVGQTSEPLTTVSTVDPIKAYYNLSEQEYLEQTKQRPTASAQAKADEALELELVLVDGSTYQHKGKFYLSNREVDPKTGAIRLAGVFPNPGNVLRPGQYGRIRTVTSVAAGALLIPQRAVTELQGSYQVAVVDDQGAVSVRLIKVGQRVGQQWIVASGLGAGERVVAEGTQRVKAGQTVRTTEYVADAGRAGGRS